MATMIGSMEMNFVNFIKIHSALIMLVKEIPELVVDNVLSKY